MVKVTLFLNQYHFSRYLFQKSLTANSSFKDKILKISVKIKICFNIFLLPQLKKKLFSFNITHINEENSSTVKLEIYWYCKCLGDHILKLLESFRMA